MFRLLKPLPSLPKVTGRHPALSAPAGRQGPEGRAEMALDSGSRVWGPQEGLPDAEDVKL